VRKKRKLFDELMEGFDALADQRAGKRTLRTHAVKSKRVHAGELFQSQADHASLRGLLERLDVPQERIDLELAAMHPVRFARADQSPRARFHERFRVPG
jgi:hypothetical protein